MNEGPTQNLSGGRSFEERVFARFDGMDVRFDAIDTRFEKIESRVDAGFEGLDRRAQALEAKAMDTKPIWERALAEILEVKKGVEDLNRKLDVLNQDVLQVRADQRLVHKRMDAVESRLQ